MTATARAPHRLADLKQLADDGGTWADAAQAMSMHPRRVRRYLTRHNRADLAIALDHNTPATTQEHQ